MEEALSGKLKISLLLSKLNLSMSKAEATESCKIYFTIASLKIINNLLVLELEAKENLHHLLLTWLNRLALAKEAYLLIGTPEGEADAWKGLGKTQAILTKKAMEETKIRISTRSLSSSGGAGKEKKLTVEKLGKTLEEQGFRKTDLENPDLEFVILRTNPELIGLKLWENTDDFEARKAHRRPVPHPTATNPRLARAMLNLAGARQEALDPFCGAGGILLEAAELGLRATGVDIDPLMVKRAELNLRNQLANQARIELREGDALAWKHPAECVVTDLPYGRSSKLEGDIAGLLSRFLGHYAGLTDKIVVCFPSGTQYEVGAPWKILYEFEIYVHKSLTRKILVLGK
jgi:tRNA (guanine10-N2)-dimethyltransferase